MPKSRLTERARQLRAMKYAAEEVLWRELRGRKLGGWKWKRQVPRGDFILDFYCFEAAVVVELDGWTHDEPEQAERDVLRTAALEEQGLMVVRIPNKALWDDMVRVRAMILDVCGEAPPLGLLPARG